MYDQLFKEGKILRGQDVDGSLSFPSATSSCIFNSHSNQRANVNVYKIIGLMNWFLN